MFYQYNLSKRKRGTFKRSHILLDMISGRKITESFEAKNIKEKKCVDFILFGQITYTDWSPDITKSRDFLI